MTDEKAIQILQDKLYDCSKCESFAWVCDDCWSRALEEAINALKFRALFKQALTEVKREKEWKDFKESDSE